MQTCSLSYIIVTMQNNKFNFCPDCGSTEIQTFMNGRKWKCPKCSFELFNNIATAVGLLLFNKEGEILFEKRAKEPCKNFLAFPGGFCEPDEEPENSVVRECLEEIGIKPCHVQFFKAFPNTYVYKNIQYKTCDLFYTATLPEQCDFKLQQNEVLSLEWHKIDSLESIKKLPLAFDSAKNVLIKFVENKNED